MVLRKIRIYGDPVLREKAKPIEQINDEIKELTRDMVETMYAGDGVGLAANQIGETKRIFVMDPQNENQRNPMVFINPVIKNKSGTAEMEEGCLSLPEIRAEVKRSESIDFEALTLEGEKVSFHAEGLVARIILHETDHLDGKLFTDYLSHVKRIMIKDQLKRLENQAQQDQYEHVHHVAS